jgi:hypothetical protein
MRIVALQTRGQHGDVAARGAVRVGVRGAGGPALRARNRAARRARRLAR